VCTPGESRGPIGGWVPVVVGLTGCSWLREPSAWRACYLQPMNPAARLLRRLVVIATGALACGGVTSSTSSTRGDGGASGAAGAPDSGGASGNGGASGHGGASVGAGTGGAAGGTGKPSGPTDACHAGKACAPNDSCSYPSGMFVFNTGVSIATFCACTDGGFVCPSPYPTPIDGGLPQVVGCVYGNSVNCPPANDSSVQSALAASHTGDTPCFIWGASAVATPAVSSDGTPACCYFPGVDGLCGNGRPLRVQGKSLVASLASRRDWAA
jgi:hypothetical protein